MNELAFLKSRKLKDSRWEVVDREGNKAVGLTKQMAENQYRVLYQLGQPQVGIDMSKFINPIGGFKNE